jgi:GMP synthase (glutamine-hydrolysing)
MLGGKVAKQEGEYGAAQLHVGTSDTLFRGTERVQQVWMSHSDAVTTLPAGTSVIASTDRCHAAAFADFRRRLFGVQFHPEVAHTSSGTKLLLNFARGVCGIRPRRGAVRHVPRLIGEIRARVGNRSVFFLVSGGVDSTVAFALCAQALPRQRIRGLYVDTGLMRKGETEELRDNLASLNLEDRLEIKDASKRFLKRLRGVTNPEKKRQIIGRLFVEIQSEAIRKYRIADSEWLLGQGTIYPDTIESGGTRERAALIKTHHNRCDEIRELIAEGRVIEPLAEFYKDEVRQIGKELGLSSRLTNRWPFPGPGLAIRTIGARSSRDARQLTLHARKAVEQEGFEGVLLPIHTVGVQGDGRTYRMVAAVRPCDGRLNYKRLQALSTALCNVNADTNRVVVFVAGREDFNLAALRVRRRTLTEGRVETLRHADYVVRKIMDDEGATDSVWQFPVVIAPVSFGDGEIIILRPVNSRDGMTANFARLPPRMIRHMANAIMHLGGIDGVFLDVTNKPPATIEWE